MDELISAVDRKAKELAQRKLPAREASNLRVLPPNPAELARRLEQTTEFNRLGERIGDLSRVASTLKRSGFYNDVLMGRDTKQAWQRAQARFQQSQFKITTLMLLYGCDFHEEFSVQGARVRKMSAEELAAFCPREDVCRSFFLFEHPSRWSDCEDFWFLQLEEVESSSIESVDSEKFDFYDYFLFELGYWRLALPIALYSSGFFHLPVIIQSEPGWTAKQIRIKWPLVEWDEHYIRIPEKAHGALLEFMKRLDTSEYEARDWPSLAIAEQLYLRALESGPGMTEREFEHALLDLIKALEALVSSREEHGEIIEKLSNRVAWLSGRNEEERKAIIHAVKRAYNLRSKLMHEGAVPSGKAGVVQTNLRDLVQLTEICRRAKTTSRILGNQNGSFSRALKDLMISQREQKRVSRIAGDVCRLTNAPLMKVPSPTDQAARK